VLIQKILEGKEIGTMHRKDENNDMWREDREEKEKEMEMEK